MEYGKILSLLCAFSFFSGVGHLCDGATIQSA